MLPTKDMRIYAPDVPKFERADKEILLRYKIFIEFICLQRETAGEIIANGQARKSAT